MNTPVLDSPAAERRLSSRESTPPAVPPGQGAAPAGGSGWAVLLFGVVLPLVTLGFELVTHGCALLFGDPVPTWLHVVLVGSVAAAHTVGWRARRQPEITVAHLRTALRLNAWALGVTIPYALAFLPLMPLAAIGVVFYGIGLLPLSPFFAVLAGLRLRRSLRRRLPEGETAPRVWPALVAAWAVLFVAEIPVALTHAAMAHLPTASGAGERAALAWLRRASEPRDYLDYRWEEGPGNLGLRRVALDGLFGPVDQRQVEQSLYRVHGLTFVTALAEEPTSVSLFSRESRGQEWDFDQGGDTVGSTLRGLSLAKSQMEVRLQPAAATGYVEWTLRFDNVFMTDREARAIVQLPGGAVVSRVTLWIDGEPREAAFGGTAQVRGAYQAIVNQRRDPLLVTWAGADRVLVQCFPVPARGGTMQVRLGITCPLQPTGDGEAALRLPSFVERNFTVSDELPLVLSAAADGTAVTLDQPRASQVAAGAPDAGLTTTVLTRALAGRPAVLRVHLPSESSPTWAAVPGSDGPLVVRQELVPAPTTAESVFLVVNGSAAMAPWRDEIVAALARASADRLAGVALASDGVELAPEGSPAMQATWLQTWSFAGGQDDTAALQAAVDALRSRGGGTVVWVHGPQALVWQDAKGLCTSLAGAHVRIAALPMAGTANVLARELALTGRLTALPQLGDPADDLRQALAGGSAPAALVSHYQIVSTADAETLAAGSPPRAEVAALWTRQEVDRLLAANQLAAAREHGIAARIVTPVTGAVVLESRAQYEAAGLEPPPAPDAAVPEPATWALIAGSGVLVFAWLRRRTRGSRASQR